MNKLTCSIKRSYALLAFGLLPIFGSAQKVISVPDQQWADSALKALQSLDAPDDLSDLELCDSLNAFYLRHGDQCARLSILARKADIWDRHFRADSALAAVIKGVKGFSSQCDSMVLLELYAVRSNIHISFGDFQKAEIYCQKVLDRWPNHQENLTFKYGAQMNLGASKFYQDEFEEGLRLMRKLKDESLLNGDTAVAMKVISNIGAIKAYMGDIDSAEYFFRQNLEWTRKHDNVRDQLSAYNSLAGITQEKGDVEGAIEILDSGYMLAKTHNKIERQMLFLGNMAGLYFEIEKYDSAYTKQLQYEALKDSALNMEKIRAVTDMQEKYESEKKARQIQKMELDKLDDELAKERLTRTRNITLSVGFGILLIAGGLFSRVRYVQRSKAVIQKEKDRSEKLLLNILPASVAEELKEKGSVDAKQFEEITVLFTDFKGFTALSEKLSPAELVAEIDHCFKAFDVIMGNYGIEKIKTIGDAYMAAGGLHDPITSTPKDVVLAALEMQDFIRKEHVYREQEGRPFFEMRVGIHTGPVVAGIVGVKKFQYDIWGDTVNTASRMESSGAVDKVNISGSTYALLKNEQDLEFESRGKIAAKGKGEMEMWFTTLKNKGSSLV